MKILAIVVRYKTPIEQSHTLLSLSEAFSSDPGLLGKYGILLWDNSPTRLENPQLSFPFQYNFSDQNVGVAGAYNRALAHAESIGTGWLLLLDQDTIVTAHYLRRMLEYATEVEDDQSIATIVPFVRSHDALFSPRKLGRLLRTYLIPRSVTGVYRQDAYAANSGTVMRVAALRAVGGYSQEFWLDFSDIYIFHALYLHGKYMYVAGDLELSHSLASMNFDQEVGVERYRSFLAAENAYFAQYRSSLANLVQIFWLAARAVRQYQRYSNKQFYRTTMGFLGQRIFWSKSSYLANWKDILRKGRSIPAIAEGKVIG